MLADINARLAAITPEQFITPEYVREPGVTVVATATDDVKQLFTLRSLLTDEIEKIADDGVRLAEKMLTDAMTDPESADEQLRTPGSSLLEGTAKLEQMQNELMKLTRLHGIVDKIFWLEVRRQSPALVSKSRVCICSDWSLGWEENREEESGHGRLRELLEGRGGLNRIRGIQLGR
ncbi:MAG: hypothetical protein NUV60_00430 [Patescibacteria group bacterium]|nr:hypothetical protein [Patescibacteria group bacterium]